MSKVEVSFTPENYHVYENLDNIVVVTDILRATSAICTALHHGAREVIPVSTVEEARFYKSKGYLVGAERNGVQLEEFDFGNSPYSYMNELEDRSVVLTTTNGTKAINMAKNSFQVVVGAFTNFTALANWLSQQERDILILWSGWKGRYNLEDTLFAGALTERLEQMGTVSLTEDSALSAKYLYNLAKDDPYKFLMNSSHRRRLKKLNLKEDIRYCLSMDNTEIIPVLHEGSLVPMNDQVLEELRVAAETAED